MVDIVCDTSFLMILVAKPIKQMDKIEAHIGKLNFLVPDVVMHELERLEQKSGPKRSMLARTAIQLASSKFRIVVIRKAKHVDESIIEYATANHCPVATIDTNLRKRLISNGILVLTLSKDRLLIANSREAEGQI